MTIRDFVVMQRKSLCKSLTGHYCKKVPAIASMHHENLDCSGYPNGLGARDIPLQARILAVADVFEALTAADRPYKQGKFELTIKGDELLALEEGVSFSATYRAFFRGLLFMGVTANGTDEVIVLRHFPQTFNGLSVKFCMEDDLKNNLKKSD
jgi:hypothetical protein